MENTNIWTRHLETAKKIAKRSGIKMGFGIESDGECLTFNTWVTIRIEDREQIKKSIARTTRTMEPRFIVETDKVIDNYPNEPDDVETEEVDDFASIEEAVKCAMMLIVENEINHAIENTRMEEYLAEEKRIEKEMEEVV